MDKIRFLFVIITVVAVSSCANDIVNINGSITGIVKDDLDGHFIENCLVTLSSSGKTFLTGSDGQFSFQDLEQGTYTLTYDKTGYVNQSKTVTVTSTQNTDASVLLHAQGAFTLSESFLNFGDLSSSMTITLSNNSSVICSYSISDIPDWVSFSQANGSVAAQGTEVLNVNVDRTKVDNGPYSKAVIFKYKGNSEGSVALTIAMQKVTLSTPTVAISTSTQNITQNSFEVGGQITATGGSIVTDYGLCWSVAENPTINDNHSSNGSTQSVGEFTTTVSNLAVGTRYYVRAYATNAQGTSYSSQIAVTTQDVASDKWDGNIAKSFAGGNGTSGSPYKVKTGGQLLLMKDYNDQCFELVGNIDLNNKNWLPFEFKGTLDGAGFTISNLYINRNDDNIGLFSRLGSKSNIQNINFKGVKINANNNSNIGVLAGEITYASGSIVNNVSILLTEGSQIEGYSTIGGVIGYIDSYSKGITVSNCKVTSTISDFTLTGGNNIGGICGKANCINAATGTFSISSCTVKTGIKGSNYIGGIVGRSSSHIQIEKCLFQDRIYGTDYIGGIVGSSSTTIACKTDAIIQGNEYVGGILGYSSDDETVACYSMGSITGTGANVSGIVGYRGKVALSYSTMNGYSSNYNGIANNYVNVQDCATTDDVAKGTNTVENCTNITSHLQEAYSEYATYYNFNSTWTWTGKINDQSVNVSCPKLSWEAISASAKQCFAKYIR